MLSERCELYWGDAHTNLRPHQVDVFDRSFAAAREVLDFWPIAYYPFLLEEIKGFRQETMRQRPVFLRQWRALCAMTREKNDPGRFVCFPGYEWHGDRRTWGDHNVFYPTDDAPLDDAETLGELYEHLRPRDGIAIPHHVAYQRGERGKDWTVFDERLSPFAEIFSCHGCSEGYGSPLALERNYGMGPLVQEGSVQAGLARGLHFGIMASGDLHRAYPTAWRCGLMACYAKELTREALWESFHARRVYGVTGDRIKLDFSVAGLEMGQIGRARPPYRIVARVEGADAIARIELLRNNRVIGARFGNFDPDRLPMGEARYKLRAIFGWGPRRSNHPSAVRRMPEREWDVEMLVERGELLGIERFWNYFGQRVKAQSSSGCRFHLRTGPGDDPAPGGLQPFQGMGFEIRGTPETRLFFTCNGRPFSFTLGEARRFPAVFPDVEESERFLKQEYGITRGNLSQRNQDISSIWHAAYKTHVWPAVHENEFAMTAEWEDVPDRDGESWYNVRAVQNNGQLAWSSPVWVTPKTEG